MSLLDVDEKYINDEYFRSKGWMKSDENPGCIERQILIMNGADSPRMYIRFLLEPPMSLKRENFKESVCLEKERFKLLCSIESHLGCDSYMTIPIDVLYIDLDCTQQVFDLIIEGLFKKSLTYFKDNIY
jgi:hypothetical protein